MKRLRRVLLASCVFAAASMLFLFTGYIRSAVAQEPDTGAAITEQTEMIVEIIVLEHRDKSAQIITVEENEVSLTVVDEILEEDIMQVDEIEVIEVTENDPEIKIVEVVSVANEVSIENEVSTLRGIENEIHERSNVARIKRDKDELVFDHELSHLARMRSQDMLTRDYFSHTSPDGCGISCNFASSGYETLVWAENIARYEPYDKASMKVVAEIFVEKWLKSSGHRENLLAKEYSHHGIGAAVQNGEIIVTVIFARPE